MHSLCKQSRSTLPPSTQLVGCSFSRPTYTIGSASITASLFFLTWQSNPFSNSLFSSLSLYQLFCFFSNFLVWCSKSQRRMTTCSSYKEEKEGNSSGEAIRAGCFWKHPSVTAPGVKIVVFLAYSQQHRDDKVLSVTLEPLEPTGPLSPGLLASSPISGLS